MNAGSALFVRRRATCALTFYKWVREPRCIHARWQQSARAPVISVAGLVVRDTNTAGHPGTRNANPPRALCTLPARSSQSDKSVNGDAKEAWQTAAGAAVAAAAALAVADSARGNEWNENKSAAFGEFSRKRNGREKHGSPAFSAATLGRPKRGDRHGANAVVEQKLHLIKS